MLTCNIDCILRILKYLFKKPSNKINFYCELCKNIFYLFSEFIFNDVVCLTESSEKKSEIMPKLNQFSLLSNSKEVYYGIMY